MELVDAGLTLKCRFGMGAAPMSEPRANPSMRRTALCVALDASESVARCGSCAPSQGKGGRSVAGGSGVQTVPAGPRSSLRIRSGPDHREVVLGMVSHVRSAIDALPAQR